MKEITIEDYRFLRMIGHPYTGKVEGYCEVFQKQDYFEVCPDTAKNNEIYFQKASYTINSAGDIEQKDGIWEFLYQIKDYSIDIYKWICDKYSIFEKDGIKELSKECKDEILEWYSLVKIAGNMTKDWFLGEGDETRHFSNDKVTQCMKISRPARRCRIAFYNKARNAGYIKGMTWEGRGKFDLLGPFYAGLDPIEQFVGSCNVKITCTDGRNLHFVLWNRTSFNSFLYHLGTGINWLLEKGKLPQMPDWDWQRETFKPMSNMEQYYEWDEPVDFSLYKLQKK